MRDGRESVVLWRKGPFGSSDSFFHYPTCYQIHPQVHQFYVYVQSNPCDVLISTLPSLKPASFPNRDKIAQDCAVAAMANFLGTTIKIFTTYDTTPILHTFNPYTQTTLPCLTLLPYPYRQPYPFGPTATIYIYSSTRTSLSLLSLPTSYPYPQSLSKIHIFKANK